MAWCTRLIHLSAFLGVLFCSTSAFAIWKPFECNMSISNETGTVKSVKYNLNNRGPLSDPYEFDISSLGVANIEISLVPNYHASGLTPVHYLTVKSSGRLLTQASFMYTQKLVALKLPISKDRDGNPRYLEAECHLGHLYLYGPL